MSSSALDKNIKTTNSFLFETLDPHGKANIATKRISSNKAKKVFHSLEDLDNFIVELYKQYPKAQLEGMGFAGYVSYEGEVEFAFYESLEIDEDPTELNSEGFENEGAIEKAFFKIKEPDSKAYIDSLKKCQEHIAEGDIYQANLTRKFIIENKNPKNSKNRMLVMLKPILSIY